MTKTKKILIASLAIFVCLGALLSWWHYRVLSSSFAPEEPQQAVLASRHTDCIAFYVLLSRASNGQPASEMGKSSKLDMERHAKAAFNFSPDKEGLKTDVAAALSRAQTALQAASDGNTLKNWYLTNERSCNNLIAESTEFVSRVEQRRKSGK
jgi:hypothetical protein